MNGSLQDTISIKISNRHRNTYNLVTGINVCWEWTCKQFGLPGQQPSGFRWQWDTRNTFYFRDPADAVLFALRWA